MWTKWRWMPRLRAAPCREVQTSVGGSWHDLKAFSMPTHSNVITHQSTENGITEELTFERIPIPYTQYLSHTHRIKPCGSARPKGFGKGWGDWNRRGWRRAGD